MKKLLITLCVYLIFYYNSSAQQAKSSDSIMWDEFSVRVVVKAPSISLNNQILSNSSLHNRIKNDQIVQCFPYSQNDYLKRVYRITSLGKNASELFTDLSKLSEVDHVERIPLITDPALSYFDPSDYFWTSASSNAQGDLWHLKRIQTSKAWDITKGHSNVKIATIDQGFDLSHPDLNGKFIYNYDAYDNSTFTNCLIDDHGTGQASYIAANTSSGGFLSGIGFNCKMIGFNALKNSGVPIGAALFVEKAHYASLGLHADVLTSSAGYYYDVTTNFSTIDKAAVKEILDHGTVIVWPAGNGFDNGAHPYDGHSRGPLSAYYDERVIVVTSTDDQDKHYFYNNSSLDPAYKEWTHSHYPEVDVGAPGYLTMGAICVARQPSNPYFWGMHGTSYATPIVAGLAGLIKSVNPCFSAADVQHLIKTTTDPIADEASYSGMVGTGRINAYQAVLKALTYKAQYEQNKTYTNRPFTYVVNKHTILIGYSVTGSLPNGPLTIQAGADVRYTARNYIEAKPGFEALRGSGFEWKIDPDLAECN